jgi:ABC-type transport system involved in multi-copper enzyme maturation permease subunit
MGKLIALELRKLRWRGLALGALAATLVLTAWFVTIANAEYSEYGAALAALGAYVRVTFIIFAAVLAARLVIDEYRTRTIGVLFMYPVPRRQLLVAKLVPLAGITFGAVLGFNVLAVALFLGVDRALHLFGAPPTSDVVLAEGIRMVIWAVAAAGLSLVPVFFGMLRKTVPATIVSAVVLSQLYLGVSLRPDVYGSLERSMTVALGWVALGVGLAYAAIRDVERADIA